MGDIVHERGTATTSATAPDRTGSRRRWRTRLRRIVADDRAWLGAALLITLLIGWSGDEASSLAWLNPLLFIGALTVRWADQRYGRRRLRLGPAGAVAVFLAAGWAFGMVVELTLAAGGDGFGGMHPDTRPSFIIAQGYYLPAVLFTWWAVRRYGLDERRAFWFAGTMAWWEALTLGAVAMLSPAFPLAPLLIAYYASTYALCGMTGLLIVDRGPIHRFRPIPITTRALVARGFVAGALSWTVFIAWAHLAARWFGFEV